MQAVPKKVVVNPDDTDFVENPTAYTVQADRVDITSNPVNPGPATVAYTDKSANGTPANTPGWTVQSVNSGKSS
jgi:hypothetical protein